MTRNGASTFVDEAVAASLVRGAVCGILVRMRGATLQLFLVFAVHAANAGTLELLAKVFPPMREQLFRNLKGQRMEVSYAFDVARTPEQALREGKGGQCNMHARVAALSLMKAGIPAGDLRIVSAVNDSSLNKLCSNKKSKPAAKVRDEWPRLPALEVG